MVIRTVLFQPFTIPSGSMMPTLLVGDYIFVNKFAYGYSKFSLPFSPDLFSGRILEFSEPKRGDVIVFRLPSRTDIDYIKRLIGLPGDKVQMIDGVLHINGKAVPKVPDGAFTSDYSQDPGTDVPVLRETLDNGVSYDSLDHGVTRGDNTQEFVVPPGHYFFMGDNRDNSLDSRFDVGYVPAENLVGRASVIFFSLGNDTSFREIWKWPSNMRWDRIFKVVR
jgi:signal peptidase I